MPRARKKQNARPRAPSPIPVPHDEVAREAFRLFQARHGVPGDHVADWFEAERIVRTRKRVQESGARAASAGAASRPPRLRGNRRK